jgi:hypothetical protein
MKNPYLKLIKKLYEALSTRPQQSYRNVSRETFGTIARAEAFQPAVRF